MESAADGLLTLGQDGGHGPYITSFADDGDLLGQWRAYGSAYALGFDAAALSSIGPLDRVTMIESDWVPVAYLPPVPVELVRVDYATPTAGAKLSEMADSVFGDLTFTNQRHHLDISSAVAMVGAIARFKHPGFSDEREWRLITTERGRRDFRPTSSGLLVPYTPLPIDLPTALKEVVVSPTLPPAATTSLQEWLHRQGLDLVVRSSALPFRVAL
jgi:hypothetical protein